MPHVRLTLSLAQPALVWHPQGRKALGMAQWAGKLSMSTGRGPDFEPSQSVALE